MRLRARLMRDCRGVAALEFALVLPFMLVLYFGTVEITQLIRVSNKLTMATETAADIIGAQNTYSLASLQNAQLGSQLMMKPFSATPLQNSFASISFNSAGAASAVTWQVLQGTNAASVPVATLCSAAAGLGLGNDSVVIVTSSYKYTGITSYVLPTSWTLSKRAFVRPRDVSIIPALLSILGILGLSGTTGSC